MNAEKTINPKVKICPSCGSTFECVHNTDCWCMHYKLSKEQLEILKAKYNDCICEDCMKGLSN